MHNHIGKVGLVVGLVLLLAGACSKKSEGGGQPQAPGTGAAQAPAGGGPEQAAKTPATGGQPGTGTQPGTAETPAAGGQPGTGETPAAGGQPGTGVQPGTGETPPPPPAVKTVLVEFPAVEQPAAAGPAYLIVNRTGIVRLDGGAFKLLETREKNFKEAAVAPDGTLWAIAYGGLYKSQGDKLVKIGGRSSGADHLAIGPQGEVWLTDFQGVARFDGTAWTTEEKSALGADVSLLDGVAVDPSGKPWIVSSNAIHSREADGWKTADLSGLGEDKFFFEAVAVGPAGEIYAAEMHGLLQLKDGKWAMIKLGDDMLSWGSASKMAVGAGRVVVAYNLGALAGLLPDGKIVQKTWSEDGAMDFLQAMTVDGAGRIWVSSDAGLAVLEPGGNVTTFGPGTIAEAPGRIEALAVAGGGPALPAVGEPRVGTIKGKVTKGGQPVVGADMEICASPDSMFQETPCTDSSWHLAIKTDEQGGFTFENVPIYTYGFAIQTDGKWATSFLTDCCEQMQPGQVLDVGEFTLE